MPVIDTKEKSIGEYCSTYEIDNQSEQSQQTMERTENFIRNINSDGGYMEVLENTKKALEELKQTEQIKKKVLSSASQDSEKKRNIVLKLKEMENQNNINNRKADFYYNEKTRLDVIIDILLVLYIAVLIVGVVLIIVMKKYKDFKLFLILAAFILPIVLFNFVYDNIAIQFEKPQDPKIQGDLTLKAIELSNLYNDQYENSVEKIKLDSEYKLSQRANRLRDLLNQIRVLKQEIVDLQPNDKKKSGSPALEAWFRSVRV